ncbi:hypothetical protein HGRIS_005537 [Hohenbuehelia grisea]|uniref:Cytochrome P450 n=1 Tax=Hohenbuehelia grisea TaxID=104357 RepID=A0ABR3JX65_9AGAR
MFNLFFIIAKCALIYLSFKFATWILKPYLTRSPFRSIPGPPSASWITGNLGQLFTSHGLPFHNHIVNHYGGVVKVHGFFGDEQLYISDPQALQSIVVKDQDAFEETAVFTETNKVIFGPGLVATTGDQHKRQRKIVKPVFSVPHLRKLTTLIYSIADKLADVLSHEVNSNQTNAHEAVLDMSEWVSRVALETVGQAVLGYSFDPLDSRQSNPYTSAVKELIPTLFSLSLIRQFAPFLSRLGSPAFRRRLVELTPIKAVQKVKNMSDVMYHTARGILQQKREALLNKGSDQDSDTKDLITELLRANEHLPSTNKLTDSELIGQMTVLIFGAQDTTASALSRLLFMLAAHPDVQRQLKAELETARGYRYDERLGYDELMELPWLDAVIKETLRLYPPVPFVRRT